MLCVGVFIVDEIIWVKKELQDRACGTNVDVDILWHGWKTQIIQSCEAQIAQLVINTSFNHSQIMPNRFLFDTQQNFI